MSDLVRVTHGVWRPAATVHDLAGTVAAVLTICPAGTVVSGVTAARLHGLWLPPGLDGPTEVITHCEVPKPADRAGHTRRDIRARRKALLQDEITVLAGIPILSEARTWLDLAEVLGMPDLVAAGDSALRGGATLDELCRLTERATHRRGVVRARAALPLLNARSRSRPESHLRYAIVSSGLPVPAVNQAIYSDQGEWLAEPDLSYDDVRFAIEYNGADHAKAHRMGRDITRDVDVQHRGGWRTLTLGAAQVFGRPDQAVALIRQIRRERGADRYDPWAAGPGEWRNSG